MKKVLVVAILSVLSIIPLTASNIADFIVGQDSYILLYIDAGKLQKTKIYTAIKSNLPARFAKSDILASVYPSTAANGLTEKDLSEVVFSVDVSQSKTSSKESISYLIGFKLNKSITQDELTKMLTYDPSGKANLTVKQIKISEISVTEIKYQSSSLYLAMPDGNTIFGSDSSDSVVALMKRYKTNKLIALPERMTEQKKLVAKDSVLYAIAAVLPAIRGLLQSEDDKITPTNQPQSLSASLRTLIKNLAGATLNASASDTLNVNTVIMFQNSDSANVLNNLINQFMPLLKIQIFMMAQNNTQIPFLNTITNSVNGNNFVLNFSLCGDDIAGILNLSQSNQKLNLNVNSINIQN